jgi:hypothetical protein
MAKLTTAERDKIPTSKFAGKGRTFPIEDKKHARAAIMLSGKAPPSERAHIKEEARKELRSGDGGKKEKESRREDKGEKFLGAPMRKVMGKGKVHYGGSGGG